MPAGTAAAEDITGLIEGYEATLAGRAAGTRDAYRRELVRLTSWVADRPGAAGCFRADQLTRTTLEMYLADLEASGYSLSSRARAKAVASGFARWLIEDMGLLRRNPARGLVLPPQPLLAPRQLSADQRYVLRSLVERCDDRRAEAIFSLGYWAGCRVSDVSWLRMAHAHVGPKVGWAHVGHKGEKERDIDLVNAARRPLHDYLHHGGRDPDSPFVFTSQRSARLTEAGIAHWWRQLRATATKAECELVGDVTFHDLRHDFAHRAREAGWSLEEVAYYLGHITRRGLPAIATTARYTQVSREQVKDKLRLLKG